MVCVCGRDKRDDKSSQDKKTPDRVNKCSLFIEFHLD